MSEAFERLWNTPDDGMLNGQRVLARIPGPPRQVWILCDGEQRVVTEPVATDSGTADREE